MKLQFKMAKTSLTFNIIDSRYFKCLCRCKCFFKTKNMWGWSTHWSNQKGFCKQTRMRLTSQKTVKLCPWTSAFNYRAFTNNSPKNPNFQQFLLFLHKRIYFVHVYYQFSMLIENDKSNFQEKHKWALFYFTKHLQFCEFFFCFLHMKLRSVYALQNSFKGSLIFI